MTDLSHTIGADLEVSAGADLLSVSGSEWGRQRVLRRLLTNPGDCIFHPEYGAGLPAMVGRPVNEARIAAIVRAQMLQEGAVARSPMPTVEVTSTPTGTVTLHVRYADANTGEAQLLTVPIA